MNCCKSLRSKDLGLRGSPRRPNPLRGKDLGRLVFFCYTFDESANKAKNHIIDRSSKKNRSRHAINIKNHHTSSSVMPKRKQ